MQNIIVIDNHISEIECRELIQTFEQNKHNATEYLNSYNLSVAYQTECTLDPYLNSLLKDIEELAYHPKKEVVIDWGYLVCRPKGSSHPIHKDDVASDTLLTSITYLNECDGGCTFFNNGRVIEPKVGRTIYFDGNAVAHGVSEVLKYNRYTLALWYK